MDIRFRSKRFLLTENELKFFGVLRAVLHPRYHIACKVRLADIITCRKKDWKVGGANRIAQKHIDFVIFRVDTSRIVAAIELDDSSHAKRERMERDQFVNELFRAARVRLVRIPAAWDYSAASLEQYLTKLKISKPSGGLVHAGKRVRPAAEAA